MSTIGTEDLVERALVAKCYSQWRPVSYVLQIDILSSPLDSDRVISDCEAVQPDWPLQISHDQISVSRQVSEFDLWWRLRDDGDAGGFEQTQMELCWAVS